MQLKSELHQDFYAALRTAGMPPVPGEFSVVPRHQLIASSIIAEMAAFIAVFDRVTGREAWQTAALHAAPTVARMRRKEVCFFSAFDFHLPEDGPWELIEFNDNGSGFLFAAIINAVYYEAAALRYDEPIAAPAGLPAFDRRVGGMVEQEAAAFFGKTPMGLFMVLDDAEALRQGKFRRELELLCELLRRSGLPSALGSAAELSWNGDRLTFNGQPVSFIVNRSTDFFWQSGEFADLREAYLAGRVYVAPNPFSYATRSDKRLLEWLALPDWDNALKIEPAERQMLSRHVPETHVLRADNIEALARRKAELVFKPLHGFAGKGLLDAGSVGRSRLRRLLTHGEGYVAQRRVAKPCIDIDGVRLWTDLRVWAYRGVIFQLSGRASKRPDRLDLTPPGGWLPTYASAQAAHDRCQTAGV